MPERPAYLRLSQAGANELKVAYDAPAAASCIAASLRAWLGELGGPRSELVVLCIGTDRSTGDALGPLVGTFLTEAKPPGLHVCGTLDQPVHAANLDEAVASLAARPTTPVIAAVDACLGRVDSVGTVTVGRGFLRPGAGVNKNLPAVGDVYLTGVVNVGGFMEYFVLQNTRLNLVVKMARVIAEAIREAAAGLDPPRGERWEARP